MEIPKLKYVKNSEEFFETSEEPRICECCGKETHVFTSMIYSEEEVNCICADCVVSCKACSKFDGFFNEAEEIDNIEAYCTVTRQTPTIQSYQEIIWPACCNDYCTYLRRCTEEDLKDEKIREAYNHQLAEDIKIEEIDPDYLILFQCEKCGKHHLELDLD